jgi:O-antigen/teichoic acid export membrane protein
MLSRRSSASVSPAALRAARIARNVGYNFAAQVWLLALAVVTTPIVVHELGIEAFGLYSLVLSLVGYFALLDLGFGVATVKFLSEFHGRADARSMQRVISNSVAVYLAVGVLGAAAIAALSLFAGRLNLSPALTDVARGSLYVASVGFLVTMVLSAFTAIPNALQRMDLTNRRAIGFGTASSAGTVVLLLLGYGLVEVLALTVAVTAVAAGSLYGVSRRLLPSASFRPRCDREMLRVLGRFGALKFANQAATQTVYHLDKFLVAALVSVAAVAYYAVPVLIAQRLAALVGNVSSAFLPAASSLHGEGDERRFEELYFRATKVVATAVLPVASVVFFFSEPILRIWLGEDFAHEASLPLKVLTVGYALNALTTIPAVAADSRNRPQVTTAFSVVSAVANVALSVALIPPFGIVGASFAILLNTVLLLPPFVWYVHRRVLHLGLADLGRRSLLRPFAAAVLSWPLMALLAPLAESVPLLALGLVVSLGAYFALTVVVRVYDGVDRDVMRNYLSRVAASSP